MRRGNLEENECIGQMLQQSSNKCRRMGDEMKKNQWSLMGQIGTQLLHG
jgi:hypothetical protein